ncbi:SNF2 family N-terminal domain-containing protein [Gautieria morchelliformis]|nr:SNF2 family N-terminal domain-containing protein [Gautieria morchelliformis]
MSSTVSSSATSVFSETDFDMDAEIESRDTTAVPSSSPAPSEGEIIKQSKKLGVISDEVSTVTLILLCVHRVEHQRDLQERLRRLNILLEKSSVYTSILGERMNQTPSPKRQSERDINARDASDLSKAQTGSKRARDDEEENDGADGNAKRLKSDGRVSTSLNNQENVPRFKQPEDITGAKLRDYQLVGVEWLTSLWANGVNGILADEMGLGCTLQTIAFLAHVRRVGSVKPSLVVCPLSVLHNWADEFEKFAPSIPVCMYHGTPAERAELRRTTMKWPAPEDISLATRAKPKVLAYTQKPQKTKKASTKSLENPRKKTSRRSKRQGSGQEASTRRSTRLKGAKPPRRAKYQQEGSDGDTEDEAEDQSYIPDDAGNDAMESDEQDPIEDDQAARDDAVEAEAYNSQRIKNTFPVILTTYEMIIKDRKYLSKYEWNFIVVDEGHRLKNMDCKLMQEIKKYDSANRLILTGTPLHNNLAELWSLLNFILPDIFTDLDSFQEWFNLPTLQSALPNEQSRQLISQLHGILKPFLLRRLKVDVEHSLPPKKEYVLYAPLSERQREIYDAVLSGVLRSYLINGKQDGDTKAPRAKREVEGRRMRKRGKVSYRVDGDDDEWFDRLEEGEFDVQVAHEEQLDIGRQFQYKHTVKQVNSMKLQNTIMQLRKVCSHPFLFDWPVDPVTREPVVNEQLVNASGKMMILDRLLTELFARGHKVLLFSQFTTMLDIVEEWADSFKSWPMCRIDGSTGPHERRAEMNRFQNGGDDPNAPRLFLLSTRAGGLGINLTAADTVIFYDQDWNPQMDIQAQDRAHRIGQTKPVLIFRLVSAHTVETKILQRANEKRQLEALVIAKDKFRMPGSRGNVESIGETAASLLRIEGEKIEVVPSSEVGKTKVISDSDLEKLLDRSPEVFAGRGKGWTSGTKVAEGGRQPVAGDVAFEVFQAPVNQCNDSLAAMMGEKIE